MPVYRTAYEESLAEFAAGKSGAKAPDYIRAADTLSEANSNQSFLDDATDFVTGVPKFIGASVISGANQLYNVPADIGNLFGADFETSDAANVISALDSDLGAFYQEKREFVDLAGFMLSSLVPGSAGVKVLSLGQNSLRGAMGAGKFGTGMGKALGLLVPAKEKHLAAAIAEINNTSRSISLLNNNALSAIKAGIGQNVLEATAFEVAVAATLFNSPVLENQSIGDLALNVAIGGGVFGLVGGAVDATRVAFALKRASKAADEFNQPWTSIPEAAVASEPYERLALDLDSIYSTPTVPVGLNADKYNFLTLARDKKITKLQNRVRSTVAEIANGDQVLATALFQGIKNSDADTALGAVLDLGEIARFSVPTKLDKNMAKLTAKVKKGTATAEELDALVSTRRAYVKLHGEGSGATLTEIPTITQLSDTLKPGQTIKATKNYVLAGDKKYDFSLLPNTGAGKAAEAGKAGKFKHWDMLAADPMEASARYIWASNLPKFTPSTSAPVRVLDSDLPLLEKLLLESTDAELPFVKISSLDSAGNTRVRTADTISDKLAYLGEVKSRVANDLLLSSERGVIGSSPEVVANKLRSILGVTFSTEKLTGHTKGRTAVFGNNATRIDLNVDRLTSTPLHQLVNTLLHEEGHLKFFNILKAGGIPAGSAKQIQAELVAASKKARPAQWASVEGAEAGKYWDYLNDTHELMADTFSYFSQNASKIAREAPEFNRLYGHLVRPLDKALVDSYRVRATKLTQDEIAAMTNVRSSYLSGNIVEPFPGSGSVDDLLAHQGNSQAYTDQLVANGSRKESDGLVNTLLEPQYAKLDYNTSRFQGMDNFQVEAVAHLKQQQTLYQEGVDRMFVAALPDEAENFINITSQDVATGANRGGAGGGAITSASSNYNSLAANVEYTGKLTHRITEAKKVATKDTLQPYLYALSQNQEAVVEFSTINNTLRNIEEVYALAEDGSHLLPIKLRDYRVAAQQASATGKVAPKYPTYAQADTPERIAIANVETSNLMRNHIAVNGSRVSDIAGIRAAQGMKAKVDPTGYYAPPVNPKDFNFFATVADESIVGIGHSKTLYAATEKELEAQIAKLSQLPNLKVRTKGDAEQYYKSIGQWEYEKSLNQNFLNASLKRAGVSASYFVPTDARKVTGDLLNWHMDRETGLVRELVSAKYQVQFEELKRLGDDYTDLGTSRFSNAILDRFAGGKVDNPYEDYVKTALNVGKEASYPWWRQANTLADETFSKMFTSLSASVEAAKTEAQLLATNKIMKQAGYKGASYDVEMEIFANAGANKQLLSETVQMANSVLTTVVLRWDALNAGANAVFSSVLLGSETKAVMRAINAGDSNAVGELAQLMKVGIPGTDQQMMAPKKLIANAIKKFGSDKMAPGSPELEFYKRHGFATTISEQYASSLDALTFTGSDVAGWKAKVLGLQAKLGTAASTGEKWTGNRLAEEFNRFVAADVMKQITDVGVKHKLISPQEQLSYINTFVNRTQGNYLASQRPMLFKGPVGQAIGLFQTYQFNLMQQLLRHVGEGHSKDAMTLLALQGTVSGMHGLPGFDAVNTHIIGTASGNTEHKDIYNATYGALGKEAGDWLMYGVASNALGLIDPDLKINLYTRGDLNPRRLSIIPTNPADVPIYQAATKVFGNIFNTAAQLNAGGDVVGTLIQGLEHNGISRPLAGLAQAMEATVNPEGASFSTSSRGNVIAANDFLSLTNLTRIVGGKPMDEAVALDAMYRFKSYALADGEKRRILGQAIKTTMLAGKEPSQEQIEGFIGDYVATGGRQEQFNSWFGGLYKTANLSQANKLQQTLSSPYAQAMQRIMGGEELRDFTP